MQPAKRLVILAERICSTLRHGLLLDLCWILSSQIGSKLEGLELMVGDHQ